MTEIHVQSSALAAMLLSLPLVSWGTTGGPGAATVTGAVLLTLSLVSLTALRFINLKEDS